MREFLSILEPRYEVTGTIIIEELDEFLEVIFFTIGQYEISYSFM